MVGIRLVFFAALMVASHVYSMLPSIESLYGSLKNEDFNVVEQILIRAPDHVNTRENKETLLEKAIKEKQLRIVRFLLAHGANPRLLNEHTINALELAVCAGNFEIFECVAERFGTQDFTTINNSANATLLHLALKFAWKDRWNDDLQKIFGKLITFMNINHRDINGQTLLHLACMYGNLPLVTLLCEGDANVLAVDIRGEIPLYTAIMQGKSEVVAFLLSLPKTVTESYQVSRQRTCLNMAILRIRPSLFTNTLRADGTKSGRVLSEEELSLKSDTSRYIAQILIESYKDKCPDCLTMVDSEGNTGLHCALSLEEYGIAQALLQTDAKYNVYNKFGKSPLLILLEGLSEVDTDKKIEVLGALTQKMTSSDWSDPRIAGFLRPLLDADNVLAVTTLLTNSRPLVDTINTYGLRPYGRVKSLRMRDIFIQQGVNPTSIEPIAVVARQSEWGQLPSMWAICGSVLGTIAQELFK